MQMSLTDSDNISKNLKSQLAPDFATKFVRGGFGPPKTSTFGISDVIHVDMLKF